MNDCDERHEDHCWHRPEFDPIAVEGELAFCCRCDWRVIERVG